MNKCSCPRTAVVPNVMVGVMKKWHAGGTAINLNLYLRMVITVERGQHYSDLPY